MGLRTSEEVYHRLRWDPAFPAKQVVIGYLDRPRGVVEIPLLSFTPGGRIPWGRVRYFRLGTELLWDREARLDRVFAGGAPQAAGRRPAAVAGDPWPFRTFDRASGQWVPAAGPGRLPERPWTALTWNVLAGRREGDPDRRERLVETLGMLDADVVGLQEADGALAAALREADWARGRYGLSDAGPEDGPLLLAKAPPARLERLALGPGKPCLIASFASGERPLHVVVLHLTSDRAPEAARKRAEQLQRLEAALPVGEDRLLLGDFNAGDDQPLPAHAAVDLWRLLRPEDPGYTYHPEENPLAAATSETGRPRRLDRVMLDARAGGEGPLPAAIKLVGRADPASDHYGVLATLQPAAGADLASAPPVPHSALAVSPPPALWGPLQAVRRRFDPAFSRWMPHLTLLPGFLHPALSPQAAAAVREILAAHPPFELELAEPGLLRHARGATLTLLPDEAGEARLQALWSALIERFPRCAARETFAPHLTLGWWRDAADAEAALADLDLPPLRFRVEALDLLNREEDAPFSVRYRIPLGGGAPQPRPPAPGRDLAEALAVVGWEPPPIRRALAAATAACKAADPAGAGPYLLGSRDLGVAGPESDLDLLYTGRLAGERFQAAVPGARAVRDAVTPVVKLEAAGTSIDILYARYPAALPLVPPEALTSAQRASLDPDDQRALLGRLEAGAVRAAVGVDFPAFQLALRGVRAWASARQLDSSAWGGVGGLGWAVLLASTPAAASPEGWIVAMFERLVERGWAQPYGLGDPPAPEGRGPAQVLSTLPPRTNIARNVTAGTAALLLAEALEALDLAWDIQEGRRSWVDLLAAPRPAGPQLALALAAPDPAALAAARGWLQRHALSLILDLEQRVAIPLRPWPRPAADGATLRYRIGLERPPEGEERARIDEVVGAFTARLPAPAWLAWDLE